MLKFEAPRVRIDKIHKFHELTSAKTTEKVTLNLLNIKP